MTPVNRTTTLLLFLFLSSLSSNSYSLPLPSISFSFPSDSSSSSSSFPLLSIQNHRLTKRQDPAVPNDAGSTGTEPQPRSQGGAVSRLGVIEFGAFSNGHHPGKSEEKNGATNEGNKDRTPESQGKSEPINADTSANGETEKKEIEKKEVQDQDKAVEKRERPPVKETTRDDRRSVVKGGAKDQAKVVRKARVVSGQPPKSRGSDQVRSSRNPRLRVSQPDVARKEFENGQSMDRPIQERRARKVVVTRPRRINNVEGSTGKIDQAPKRTIGRKFADSHRDIAIDGPMEHHAVGRKPVQHKRGRKCRRVSYG